MRIDQTIVARQILRNRGDAVFLEVLGCPADNSVDRGELPRHHVRRQYARNTDRQIVAFFCELEKTVADGEINLYFGILSKELREGGSNVQRGKGHWCCALQHASWLCMQTVDQQRRLLRLLNDAGTVIIEGSADLRQAQLARRTIQKPRSKRFLKFRNLLAYH